MVYFFPPHLPTAGVQPCQVHARDYFTDRVSPAVPCRGRGRGPGPNLGGRRAQGREQEACLTAVFSCSFMGLAALWVPLS